MNHTERLFTDVMLGKLTRYLRMMGYDVVYAADDDIGVEDDDEIVETARDQDRILLTRDTDMERHDFALVLESRDIEDQLKELADEGFGLRLREPARCSVCNGDLTEVNGGNGGNCGDELPEAHTGTTLRKRWHTFVKTERVRLLAQEPCLYRPLSNCRRASLRDGNTG
ncbi:MAG: DUF5615 family PIN-like protein [Halobacteria archaeon]|nr:DUF5615 family PIN-like protein [Halobacteria archaeon]